MIEKTILVSNLDIFVYDLKNELDSKNMDYVMINEGDFCEVHIGNFIYYLHDINNAKLSCESTKPFSENDLVEEFSLCAYHDLNKPTANKKSINYVSKKKQMKYQNMKYKTNKGFTK